MRLFSVLLGLFAALAGCEPAPTGAPPAGSASGASPNASILPGPRADAVPDGIDGDAADAGPRGGLLMGPNGPISPRSEPAPPTALRPDRPLPLDPLARSELTGISLTMAMKWRDVPGAPRAPEVNAEGIARAAAATQFTILADVAQEGRVRLALEGRGFPLPPHTELRGRDDRYGTVLLWPEGDRYRPVAPGSLRALLGERRVDATPLSAGTVLRDVKARPPAIDGLAVEPNGAREVQIESSFGKLQLVFATVPEAGRGALPFCRLLLELGGIEPSSTVCKADELPLAARFDWKGGGGIDLETKSAARRTDLEPQDLAVPPPSATYTIDGLPEVPFGVFLTRDELAAFRSKPAPGPREPDAPGEGYFADNQTDQLLYLVLDGVPTVAVPPRDSRYLIGTAPGSYVAQWRTFLGERVEPPATVVLPARLKVGVARTATPDAPP